MEIAITLIIITIFSYFLFSQPIVYLKYYLFDWDDNLLYMPCQIYLMDVTGKEIPISTAEYAQIKEELKKGSIDYNGHVGVGLSTFEPFRDFRCSIIPFLVAIQNSKLAPSWNDFVEAVNSGAYFGIITARAHEPKVFKETVRIFIENDYKGISRNTLIESLKKRKAKAHEVYTNDEEEINNYLNNCLFYPVGYLNENGSQEPEVIKKEQIKLFQKKIRGIIKRLNKEMIKRGNYQYKLAPKFGFSDDDKKNIEASLSIKDLNVYLTFNGDKNKIK
jgi:hypothetical protein